MCGDRTSRFLSCPGTVLHGGGRCLYRFFSARLKRLPVSMPDVRQKRVVVIGGGITGLAAVHRLVELNPRLELVLVESGRGWAGCWKPCAARVF